MIVSEHNTKINNPVSANGISRFEFGSFHFNMIERVCMCLISLRKVLIFRPVKSYDGNRLKIDEALCRFRFHLRVVSVLFFGLFRFVCFGAKIHLHWPTNQTF